MKKVLTRAQAGAVACAVVAATGLVVVGYQHVLPPLQPKMLAGSTWLASRSVGHLTLVDGISAAVSASVQVAQPNVPFTVAIGDQRAYTVDNASGNVVGISGATLESASMKPLTSQVRAITVHPVGDAYIAIDSKNGVLQAMGTAAERLGAQERLPASVLAVAADERRVWLADGTSGGLLSFEWTAGGPIKRELRDVHRREATDVRILVAGDQPVVVDRTHQTATLLTASGEIAGTAPLTLGETTQVSASAQPGRVLVVEPSRGVVMSCDVLTGTCGMSFPIAAPDSDLGAAVDARGHAFVPDNATDRVHVVDLADGSVATTETLLGEGAPFELSTRDGVVFFNDPNSEKAGVIDRDGRIRRIDKYDPTKPPTASSSSSSPPTKATTTTVPSGSSSGPRPSLTGSRGNRPDGTTGSVPLPTGSSSNSPDVPHINEITASPGNPEAGEEVSFAADVTGAVPQQWEWEVRGPGGDIKTAASTPRLSYRFEAAATYEVKLTVFAGTRRDEQTRNLVVMAVIASAECGDTITQNVRLRKDLVCTGNALTVGAKDVVIDLNGHSITGSGGEIGVWVPEGQHNATVRNGTIRSFQTGVVFNLSNNSDVEQIRFESNTKDDVRCFDGTDLTVVDSEFTRGITCLNAMRRLRISGSVFTDAAISLHSDIADTLFANCKFTDSDISLNNDANVTAIVDSEVTRTAVRASQSNGLNIARSRVASSRLELTVHSGSAAFRDNEIYGAEVGIDAFSASGGEFLTVERNNFHDNGIGLKLGNPIQMPLGPLNGLVVANNRFSGNRTAGVFMDTSEGGPGPHLTFNDNTFISNGHRPNGLIDREGRPVDDGLHINSQAGSDIVLRNNKTQNNADHGIEAVPGTVVDGGGNTSAGNPAGCLGVAC
ncbi:right-handed parallel beta-helix repeat-containing protein [Lentzea sp. NPDC092896]|uniref:right-handed parallel beta-helix repeat-containing protein n=1 Tax=Lentzea sp. NPDC092896 TaxID=3364127 RepID=UPI00380B149F